MRRVKIEEEKAITLTVSGSIHLFTVVLLGNKSTNF